MNFDFRDISNNREKKNEREWEKERKRKKNVEQNIIKKNVTRASMILSPVRASFDVSENNVQDWPDKIQIMERKK